MTGVANTGDNVVEQLAGSCEPPLDCKATAAGQLTSQPELGLFFVLSWFPEEGLHIRTEIRSRKLMSFKLSFHVNKSAGMAEES